MRFSLRRPFALPVVLVAFVLLGGQFSLSSPTDSVVFEVSMDQAMTQLWYDMPQDTMSPNVEMSGNTQPDCANAALRKARVALTWVGAKDAARRAAIQTIDIAKDIFEHAFGISWAGKLGDAIQMYLESNSVDELQANFERWLAEQAGQQLVGGANAAAEHAGEHASSGAGRAAARAGQHLTEGYPPEKAAGELAKALWDRLNGPAGQKTLFESTFDDPECGAVEVTFELRSAPNGHKSIYFRASGNCSCRWPARAPQPMRLGRFTVIGTGDLVAQNPVIDGNTIRIAYRLSNTHYLVSASCGCPPGEDQGGTITEGGEGGTPTEPPPPPPPAYERICWSRCGDLWTRWQEVQREADHFAEVLQHLQEQLAPLQRKLAEAQATLDHERQVQQRMEQAIKDLDAIKNHPATNQADWANRMRAARWNLDQQNRRVFSAQYHVDDYQRQVSDLQRTIQDYQRLASERAAEAAAARDVYYRCAKSCYEQAVMGGDIKELPPDVQEWKKNHPETPPPPPTEKQTSMLIGVVVGEDTHNGEHTTARVVRDPKPFKTIPGLRVVEIVTNVGIGEDGKPNIDELQARIGDGPTQPCDGPVSGTVPKDGNGVDIHLGRPGQPPSSGRIPVTPGQTRIPPDVVRPQEFHTPAVYQPGTVQVIHGPFDGKNFGTSVQIAGRKAEILAETNGALYFVVPGDVPPGETAVVVEEQGKRMRFHTATVGLQMSAGQLTLEKGESTTFRATVTGADKLPESAWQASSTESQDVTDMGEVRRLLPKFQPPEPGSRGVIILVLENLSPDVVSMSGGNVVQFELTRASFGGGPYVHNGTIGAHKRGSFGIKGIVLPFLSPVAGEAVP